QGSLPPHGRRRAARRRDALCGAQALRHRRARRRVGRAAGSGARRRTPAVLPVDVAGTRRRRRRDGAAGRNREAGAREARRGTRVVMSPLLSIVIALLPGEFRNAYRADLEATIRAQQRDAAGPGARLGLLVSTIADVCRVAPGLHWDILRRDTT